MNRRVLREQRGIGRRQELLESRLQGHLGTILFRAQAARTVEFQMRSWFRRTPGARTNGLGWC
jgi:hypothetical protein